MENTSILEEMKVDKRKKKVTIIGIGNAGGQVAYLAEQRYPDLMNVVYINTSEADLAMVGKSLKFKIGMPDEVEGTGRDRLKMKTLLKKYFLNVIQDKNFNDIMVDAEKVFVVASTGGGTGSGGAPVIMEMLRSYYLDAEFILVGILPPVHETEGILGNTAQFLNELYAMPEPVTYMIYDNDIASESLPPIEVLEIVNNAIVEDIKIFTEVDNRETPYDSIDSADMEKIISTPGRLLVVRLNKNLTEKALEDVQIDDVIIKAIKQSFHAETDRNVINDSHEMRWGIVLYFSPEVMKLYTSKLEKVADFIGMPDEIFNHHAINNSDGDQANFFYLIVAGLTPINDRIQKIEDRVLELKRKSEGGSSVEAKTLGYDFLTRKKRDEKREKATKNIDFEQILNRYMGS